MAAPVPPPCPACGSAAELVDEQGLQWRCTDCEHHFLDLTPATWRILLLSMLPLPIVETEKGMVAGDPGEVIVRVTQESVEVAAYRAEFRGGEPVMAAKKWKVFDLETGPSQVAKAIQKARARRLRTYRWCIGCRKVLPPEHMADSVTCHRCAEE